MISMDKALEYTDSIMKVCDENKIPSLKSTVRDFVIEALEAKSRIANLMELTEENNFRRYYEISLKDSDVFIWCEALQNNMKYLLEQEYLNFPICCPRCFIKFDWEKNTATYQNTTVKITKLLMKMQEKYNKCTMDGRDAAIFERVLNELSILADCFGVTVMEDGSHIDQNGLARVFDFLKNENGYAIFSVNPVDIITASYNTTFSSCFRPNGEFGASVLSMARDKYTAVLYTMKQQNPNNILLKKYGRRWIHFDQFFEVVEFSRRYGVISPETTDMVKDDIFRRMGKTGLCVDYNQTLFSTCNAGSGIDIFVDENDTEIFVDKYHEYWGLPDNIRIEPATPVCLHCGSLGVDDNSKWICHECFECYICYICGEYGEHIIVGSFGGVCDKCLSSEFLYCDGCEQYHAISATPTLYHLHEVGEVCSFWLHENGYGICNVCDEIIRITHANTFPVLTNGRKYYVCESCQEGSLMTCDDCGEKHISKNMVFDIYETGENVCHRCSLARVPHKNCPVCGAGGFILKRVDDTPDEHEDTHFFAIVEGVPGSFYRCIFTGKIAELTCPNCKAEIHYDLSDGGKRIKIKEHEVKNNKAGNYLEWVIDNDISFI